MNNILILDSAATGESSVSRRLTRAAAEVLVARDPDAHITLRDVGRNRGSSRRI